MDNRMSPVVTIIVPMILENKYLPDKDSLIRTHATINVTTNLKLPVASTNAGCESDIAYWINMNPKAARARLPAYISFFSLPAFLRFSLNEFLNERKNKKGKTAKTPPIRIHKNPETNPASKKTNLERTFDKPKKHELNIKNRKSFGRTALFSKFRKKSPPMKSSANVAVSQRPRYFSRRKIEAKKVKIWANATETGCTSDASLSSSALNKKNVP